MSASLESLQTMTIRTDVETLTQTLKEVDHLLLTTQQTLAASCSMKDPSLKSVCRARARVLFLLLQLCPSHLSTAEWMSYQSHSSILRRFLSEAQ
jgi:hypothetical protein